MTKIEKMLLKNGIDAAQLKWALPIVSAQKMDGSLSICIEYKKLNPEPADDAYPILLVYTCLGAFDKHPCSWLDVRRKL